VDLEGVIFGEHSMGLEKQRPYDEIVHPRAVQNIKSIKTPFRSKQHSESRQDMALMEKRIIEKSWKNCFGEGGSPWL